MKRAACVLALLLASSVEAADAEFERPSDPVLLGSSVAEADAAYERPSDPGFPWQWDLENTGQPIRPHSAEHGTPDADIDAVEAFAAGHTGEGVLLALIGQGVHHEGSGL